MSTPGSVQESGERRKGAQMLKVGGVESLGVSEGSMSADSRVA